MKRTDTGRGRLPVAALILIMLAGICIILYPIVSNILYEKDKSLISTEYDRTVEELGEGDISDLLEAAQKYNDSLLKANIVLTDPFDPTILEKQGSAPYLSLLNYADGGIMGYLDIPVIEVNLPIYHGTNSATLEKGIGHLEQTSLPIGGESTHSVLTGHTGLAGKRMLTDLTEMEEGDIFYIHMMNDILAYEVTDIAIASPRDTDLLRISKGEDMVTIVTCYPYGVNSHRLLVTGVRTEYEDAVAQEETKDRATKSVWKEEYEKAIVLCIAIYVHIVIVGVLLIRRRRNRNNNNISEQ